MAQIPPVEMLFQKLGEVNGKLAVLALKENPRLGQIGILVREAQVQLGLLEISHRGHPPLIAAEVGLLEAMMLAYNLRPGEALQTAQSNLHAYLESMRHTGEWEGSL
ncbi:hypothetical protein [Rufibacter latericius]|uniref:Uncharacterized protein n=1 Tax=Rufibacter latericius TaxID=2487040 RepID=A0A3M9MH02_9BACT|nr:hypothetical protein [Rufibacter latericius]RNI24153.1 hypothetical protein EFB08_17425 [Rufibacter latericius]